MPLGQVNAGETVQAVLKLQEAVVTAAAEVTDRPARQPPSAIVRLLKPEEELALVLMQLLPAPPTFGLVVHVSPPLHVPEMPPNASPAIHCSAVMMPPPAQVKFQKVPLAVPLLLKKTDI
jgi:hypothetical protein